MAIPVAEALLKDNPAYLEKLLEVCFSLALRHRGFQDVQVSRGIATAAGIGIKQQQLDIETVLSMK